MSTKYLLFQVFTSSDTPLRPPGEMYCSTPPSIEALAQMVNDIVSRVGSTGDSVTKLGIALGPLALDHTDAEIVKLINDGFALAKRFNVAVAFHLDDSMFWGRYYSSLIQNPANIEWRDWEGTVNTGRKLEWGAEPARLFPQMNYAAPMIRMIALNRASLIGNAVVAGLAELNKTGQGHLFAGIITGWESQMGRDYESDDELGYAGLTTFEWSGSYSDVDFKPLQIQLVKWWMQLWARRLNKVGVPLDRLYCHIAFATPGLPVAFSALYRPGFSTYPEAGTFEAIYAELSKRGNPPWCSAEGTNLVPNGTPGEPNMEVYLAKHFNHGAVFVNLFAWGIGGDAEKNNMFRQIVESPEAIAAYRKFLSGASLSENTV